MVITPDTLVKRWTLEEYHRFAKLGGFGPGTRVEFVDGVILDRMGQNPKHSNAIVRLARVLAGLVRTDSHVRSEAPVRIGESEPVPDVTVVRGGLDQYENRYPRAEDVIVLAEVSDSSLD